VELIPGFNNTVPIVAVHNKDETLRVLEVMPPQWPDLFLQTHSILKNPLLTTRCLENSEKEHTKPIL